MAKRHPLAPPSTDDNWTPEVEADYIRQLTRPRLWQGNGMGYSPAEYAIYRNRVAVGTLTGLSASGRWQVRLYQHRRTFDSFREARQYARDSLQWGPFTLTTEEIDSAIAACKRGDPDPRIHIPCGVHIGDERH